LNTDLGLKRYGVQFTQKLTQNDDLLHRNSPDWVLEKLAADSFISLKNIFSDETHF